MRHGTRTLCIGGLMLLVGCQPLDAAFFMRLGGSMSRQLEVLGGMPLYRTTARMNGDPIELQILGFDAPARDVVDEVRRLRQLPPATGGGPAWLTWVEGNHHRHLLVLPGTRPGDSTAWLIEPRAPRRAASPGTIPDPPGFNPCPGATLRGWIALDRTRSLLTLSETPGTPEDALDAAAETLGVHGWREIVRAGGQALFAQGSRAGMIHATRATPASSTRITVFLQGSATDP
jgi:hypothetical protein